MEVEPPEVELPPLAEAPEEADEDEDGDEDADEAALELAAVELDPEVEPCESPEALLVELWCEALA